MSFSDALSLVSTSPPGCSLTGGLPGTHRLCQIKGKPHASLGLRLVPGLAPISLFNSPPIKLQLLSEGRVETETEDMLILKSKLQGQICLMLVRQAQHYKKVVECVSTSSNSGVLELPESSPGLMGQPVPPSWAPSLRSTASPKALRRECAGGGSGVAAGGTR